MHLKVSAYPIPNIRFQLTSKLQPSSSCLFNGLTHVCCIPVTRNYLSPSPGSSSSCLSPGQGCFCLVLALRENLFLLKALGQVLHSLYTGLLIFLRRKKKPLLLHEGPIGIYNSVHIRKMPPPFKALQLYVLQIKQA